MSTSLCSRSTRRGLAIALRSSGAGAGQWQQLGEMLGAGCRLVALEHYRTDGAGPWMGEHAFTLADEAARTLAIFVRRPCQAYRRAAQSLLGC